MITYHAAHVQVREILGRASDRNCLDCGAPAKHWAYDHCDPDEIRDLLGRAYSADHQRYRSLCVLCHRRFDAPWRPLKKDVIEERLGESIRAVATSLRPMSWRLIAREITKRTGIRVTFRSIRRWSA